MYSRKSGHTIENPDSCYHQWYKNSEIRHNKHLTVTLGGVTISGSHAYIKKALLNYGTPKSIKDAALLCSPIVKVRAGDKVFKGPVGEVHAQVKTLVSLWQLVAPYDEVAEANLNYVGRILVGGKNPVPKEFLQLEKQPPPFSNCPVCKGDIKESGFMGQDSLLMRGMVQRSKRLWYAPWKTRPYCAVICPHCKEIVAYENPPLTDTAFLPQKSPYR